MFPAELLSFAFHLTRGGRSLHSQSVLLRIRKTPRGAALTPGPRQSPFAACGRPSNDSARSQAALPPNNEQGAYMNAPNTSSGGWLLALGLGAAVTWAPGGPTELL